MNKRGPEPEFDNTYDGLQYSFQLRAKTIDGKARAEASCALAARTVREWGARWLDLRERSGVRAIVDDRIRWRVHVLEFAPWADLPLTAISRAMAREWWALLSLRRSSCKRHRRRKKRLAAQTLRNILNLVRRCFADAVEDEIIAVNPFASLRLHRSRSASTIETSTVLLPDEQMAGLGALALLPERWLVAFAMFSGVRQGEQWSLRLTDVTRDGRVKLCYGSDDAIEDGEDGGPRKNGRVHVIALPPRALDALQRWLAQLATYAPHNPLGLVFPTRSGKRRCGGKSFRGWRYLEMAVGRHVRWHDLRHTFATTMAAGWWDEPWSLETLCVYLDHSSVKVTERYARLVKELAYKAVERMAPVRVPVHVPAFARGRPRARRRAQHAVGVQYDRDGERERSLCAASALGGVVGIGQRGSDRRRAGNVGRMGAHHCARIESFGGDVGVEQRGKTVDNSNNVDAGTASGENADNGAVAKRLGIGLQNRVAPPEGEPRTEETETVEALRAVIDERDALLTSIGTLRAQYEELQSWRNIDRQRANENAEAHFGALKDCETLRAQLVAAQTRALDAEKTCQGLHRYALRLENGGDANENKNGVSHVDDSNGGVRRVRGQRIAHGRRDGDVGDAHAAAAEERLASSSEASDDVQRAGSLQGVRGQAVHGGEAGGEGEGAGGRGLSEAIHGALVGGNCLASVLLNRNIDPPKVWSRDALPSVELGDIWYAWKSLMALRTAAHRAGFCDAGGDFAHRAPQPKDEAREALCHLFGTTRSAEKLSKLLDAAEHYGRVSGAPFVDDSEEVKEAETALLDAAYELDEGEVQDGEPKLSRDDSAGEQRGNPRGASLDDALDGELPGHGRSGGADPRGVASADRATGDDGGEARRSRTLGASPLKFAVGDRVRILPGRVDAGRIGELVAHDPGDPGMCWAVRFDSASKKGGGRAWFGADELDIVPTSPRAWEPLGGAAHRAASSPPTLGVGDLVVLKEKTSCLAPPGSIGIIEKIWDDGSCHVEPIQGPPDGASYPGIVVSPSKLGRLAKAGEHATALPPYRVALPDEHRASSPLSTVDDDPVGPCHGFAFGLPAGAEPEPGHSHVAFKREHDDETLPEQARRYIVDTYNKAHPGKLPATGVLEESFRATELGAAAAAAPTRPELAADADDGEERALLHLHREELLTLARARTNERDASRAMLDAERREHRQTAAALLVAKASLRTATGLLTEVDKVSERAAAFLDAEVKR